MKQNVNKSGLIMKMKNPTWKVKVGIQTLTFDNSQNRKVETKLWKIKVILN